ncbi:Phosphotransferase enzyme family protein [Virgibacillus subterraneus]|uniref:Phosphotransferase enzyme family protein n=1 Tax=Virgibacillus subterraneus TaxID=621109 RepID=A0A1H9IDV2_9BACI|nr:aminoglycoside phosphotransferase family protein [Virgibacillus subterraneus]SEQ72727.1 Phosphotransferase enzyme family protein [Virgibacillus subterraneus]
MEQNNEYLSNRIVEWVKDNVDSNAKVESVSRLKGSTSSTLHSITLLVDQSVKQYVIRQFDNKEWLDEEPDLVLHEVESLRMATNTGITTPEVVACDETGEKCGIPAILMTKLKGAVELKPANMDEWLTGLARGLVKIHEVEARGFPYQHYSYNDISTFEMPSWSKEPKTWGSAINILTGPRPKTTDCFIHRDYHPANVLWDEGLVSGVVDWVNGCRGPRGVDVGHCRVNLAMLYGVETADGFLKAYQQQAGSCFTYNRYWDLLSLTDMLVGPPEVYPGWEAFGVSGLTNEMMKERLDKYVLSLLNQDS